LVVVKFLVENDANIHAQDAAALKCASALGNMEAVKLMFETGANTHVLENEARDSQTGYE
jgi:hypothetical protein